MRTGYYVFCIFNNLFISIISFIRLNIAKGIITTPKITAMNNCKIFPKPYTDALIFTFLGSANALLPQYAAVTKIAKKSPASRFLLSENKNSTRTPKKMIAVIDSSTQYFLFKAENSVIKHCLQIGEPSCSMHDAHRPLPHCEHVPAACVPG